MIHCDIADFPAIIGSDIPVCLTGLKPAATPQQNLKLLAFLNELLLSKDNPPQKILLKNIRRGQTFCIEADIEIDSKNLADILIEKGLAEKIIKVTHTDAPAQTPSSQAQNPSSAAPLRETQNTDAPAEGFIASKSGKVFHRPTCYHAKRMDKSKAVIFATREEALSSGRRPCKTCKP